MRSALSSIVVPTAWKLASTTTDRSLSLDLDQENVKRGIGAAWRKHV